MPSLSFSHPRYQPGPPLGVGAQGVVFRVVDREAPERPLVAKLWHPGVFGEDVLRGEFALLARLRIPGLVRAHDLGRDAESGALFLVEDFVSGPEAGDWLREVDGAERGRRLSDLLAQLVLTLAALHDAGFFHGDLKPAHVRLSAGGQATVLDLGAAIPQARRDDGPRGISPAYAAPEILAGAPPSVASEFYSLGALAWSVVTGNPPGSSIEGTLRTRASWVPPAVADLIESLLRRHPGDRPTTSGELLRQLGTALRGAFNPQGRLQGRRAELQTLLTPGPSSVRYLTGVAGIGKSTLASEVFTQTLLAGRAARKITLPEEGKPLLSGLLAYLRGAGDAYPFGAEGQPDRPLLLVLDGLHHGSRELLEALELFRCRRRRDRMEVLAVTRTAPEGAPSLELAPMREDELLWVVGSCGPAGLEEHVKAARGNPGWLVAALGGIPQDEEAIRERLSGSSDAAWKIYTSTILAGGRLEERWGQELAGELAPGAFGWLLERGLLGRSRGGYLLLGSPGESQPAGAPIAQLEAILLRDGEAGPRPLLALARRGGDARRLFEEAARRARQEGRREDELEALLELCSQGAWRSSTALCRLEQLARDAGQAAMHPQVLDWLEEAAKEERSILPLALRRRAEQQARQGNAAKAEELARRAVSEAHELRSVEGEAYALATVGLVELFRASWVSAYRALKEARQKLASLATIEDPEEAARLDHNLGVVAVYRRQISEAIAAFQRSLEAKERLGDRAGMRACLRNLGYALTRAGRTTEAAEALDDALALARSLGQAAGQAWCLVARAEVEVRRGAAKQAERFIAEAETFGPQIPAAVRADLWLLRAELDLALGDGESAERAIRQISLEFRQQDALVDASATTLEARAQLARIPATPRQAARLAIAAIRRARAAALPEPEERALVVLREARGTKERLPPPSLWANPQAPMHEEQEAALWSWIESLSTSPEHEAALALARVILAQAGAERVFLLLLGDDAKQTRGWAVDLDGFPLENPEKRAPQDALQAALTHEQPLYQRHLPTAGGHGCRLTLAGALCAGVRPVLLLEHRFLPGRFDGLSPALLGRWRALLALLARLGASTIAAPPRVPSPPPPAVSSPPIPVQAATTLQPRSAPRREFPSLVGQSEVWRQALARLDLAIDSDLPVLIVGETGVGKELFARALHEHSSRAAAPFVPVNCAALPDALFEAELFGHARGAFTGADRARPGLLASADGGTLFLDEIGELSLPRQASLLRVLQEHTYRPVGSDQERPVRVRVIAATNRDLERAVEQGTFRQDLLYRLDVLRIRIPPLRERPDDARELLRHFLKRAGSTAVLTTAAQTALAAHDWPGNVRELEHLAQRLAALQLGRIDLPHLPRGFRKVSLAEEEEPARDDKNSEDDERAEVLRALERSGGNISHAARDLGITRHGLKKRMLRLGLRERADPSPKP